MPPADLGSAVQQACITGNASEVVRLLAAGADPNTANSKGATALHVAAAFGHTRVRRTLLAAGASPSLPGPGGLLPIHFVAAVGHPAVARLLLEAAPGTAAAEDEEGHTPLWIAANEGRSAVIRLLLAAAPQSALQKAHDGSTPLFAAARAGHEDAVRLLLKAAPEASLEATHAHVTPLHAASFHGYASIARLLLAAAPQVASITAGGDRHYSSLYAAVLGGHLEVARAIVEAAPQTALLRSNDDGRLPLHEAAARVEWPSSAEWVQLLLAAAPETAAAAMAEGLTPLHIAALRGNAAAARLLVQAAPAVLGMRAGDERLTPLEWALAVASEAAAEAAGEPAERELQPVSAYLDTARPMLVAVPPAVSLPLLVARGNVALPLFPEVPLHWPLTAAQWAQVPAPCPGLSAALPAALQRSVAEAALLVARLPPADASRLRAFALALHRSQRQLGVLLPAELSGRILSLLDA